MGHGFERSASTRTRVALLWAASLALVACGATPRPSDAGDAAFACPRDWVRHALGGCGPALWLCGSASAGDGAACRDGAPTTEDAGFFALPDGAIGGRWSREDAGGPAIDWRPDAGLSVCPPGWPRADDGSCNPAFRTDCAEGSASLPGGTCVATDMSSCPSTPYAEVTAERGTAPVRFVRAGADDASADGSEARPFGSFRRAIDGVAAGTWLLLADGTYAVGEVVDRSVHVVGRCAARVTLRGDTDVPVLLARGAAASLDLRQVTVSGNGRGVWAEMGARATLRRVRISRATGTGIVAMNPGTRVDGADVLVEDTLPTADTMRGRGIDARSGAQVTLSRTALVDNRDIGAIAFDRNTLIELTDSVVRGTRVRGDGLNGPGMVAQDGSRVRTVRAVIEDNTSAGVEAFLQGSVAELTDTLVRRTHVLPTGIGGRGVEIGETGQLVATRLAITDVFGIALHALGADVQVQWNEGVIARVSADASVSGRGIEVNESARATLRRLVIGDARSFALGAGGGQAQIDVEDSVIEGSRGEFGRGSGRGLELLGDARIVASRIRVDASDETGVSVTGPDSELVLNDSVIVGGPAAMGIAQQLGLFVRVGGVAQVERTTIARVRGVGIFVEGDASRLEFTRGTLRDTTPTRLDGYVDGIGVAVTTGGFVRIADSVIARSGTYGVFARGAGTHVEISGVHVDSVVADFDGLHGHGILALYGADVGVDASVLTDVGELCVGAFHAGTHVALQDVWIDGVRSSPRGLGLGAMAWGGAIELRQVALRGVGGVALGASAVVDAAGTMSAGSLTASDVFVSGVRSSALQSGAGNPVEVAYGANVERGARLELERATLLGGGHGFRVAGGVANLHDVFVGRQRIAAGVRTTDSPMVVVRSGVWRENASNEIVVDDTLPDVRPWALPAPLCMGDACMR